MLKSSYFFIIGITLISCFLSFKVFLNYQKSLGQTMKKVLFILMPEDFQDLEFGEPYKLLTEAGFSVDVAGFKLGVAHGSFGTIFDVKLLLSDLHEVDFGKYDALVIPGGSGSTKYLWNNIEVQKVIKFFHKNNKIVAAICYGAVAPAQAGILTGKNGTAYPDEHAKAILAEHGVIFEDKGVVVLEKEKIITAQGPKFARLFGNAILKMLKAN